MNRNGCPICPGIRRYIEVKSATGAWGERGVALSRTQFEAALLRKHKYWLYVVEDAATPERRLFRIQNPAQLVESYVYDRGWRALAETDRGVS